MRVFLFLGTNVAILLVLSVTARLLGIDRFVEDSGGINFTSLLIFSAIFGMGGAMISLALSKKMAKAGMRVRVIKSPCNHMEAWLVQTVKKQSEMVGLRCPEVGIFNSSQPNAFATGMFRNSALVAVSTGLLEHMDDAQVEAVLGHEVSHVANGDMVTLGLLQGVINTFVIFLSRIIGILVDRAIFKSRGTGPGYFITSIIAQVILSILASMIVLWFSRYREFHADEGGARLAGRHKMISALKGLQRSTSASASMPKSLAAFGISGKVGGGLKRLFMSHPPLQERIRNLEKRTDIA